ncbi:MAG: hypothetical protein U0987_18880 [Afipia sp.]|nr:hypothetical protein [Afipia sp.]
MRLLQARSDGLLWLVGALGLTPAPTAAAAAAFRARFVMTRRLFRPGMSVHCPRRVGGLAGGLGGTFPGGLARRGKTLFSDGGQIEAAGTAVGFWAHGSQTREAARHRFTRTALPTGFPVFSVGGSLAA